MLKIRKQQIVEIPERTYLKPVDMFAKNEKKIDELERFIGSGWSPITQMLQAFSFMSKAAAVPGTGKNHAVKPVQQFLNCRISDFHSIKIRSRFCCRFMRLFIFSAIVPHAFQQTRETDCQYRLPVRNGMIKVDPDAGGTGAVQLIP